MVCISWLTCLRIPGWWPAQGRLVGLYYLVDDLPKEGWIVCITWLMTCPRKGGWSQAARSPAGTTSRWAASMYTSPQNTNKSLMISILCSKSFPPRPFKLCSSSSSLQSVQHHSDITTLALTKVQGRINWFPSLRRLLALHEIWQAL